MREVNVQNALMLSANCAYILFFKFQVLDQEADDVIHALEVQQVRISYLIGF